MKNLYKKAVYILPAALLLLAACKKSDNSNLGLITKNYNASLAADTIGSDYVAVDVDNDGVPDFKICVFNSTYNGHSDFESTNNAYIVSTQDNSLIAITNNYANYGWLREYTFNSFSAYYNYTKGFEVGDVVGSTIPAETAKNYNTSSISFERIGNENDIMGSAISPYPTNTQFIQYNEVEGDFYNATRYIGFSMLKSDGRHYGWIKIAVSNSNLNVKVISSAYSIVAGQSVTIK